MTREEEHSCEWNSGGEMCKVCYKEGRADMIKEIEKMGFRSSCVECNKNALIVLKLKLKDLEAQA